MLSKIFQFLLIRQLNENTPLEILNHLQRRLKLKTQTPHYFYISEKFFTLPNSSQY